MSAWDSFLHMSLPIALMLSLCLISIKHALSKETKTKDQLDDFKNIFGSLSQGIALTVNFPTIVNEF